MKRKPAKRKATPAKLKSFTKADFKNPFCDVLCCPMGWPHSHSIAGPSPGVVKKSNQAYTAEIGKLPELPPYLGMPQVVAPSMTAEGIEAALRSLDAQDDPSATRFHSARTHLIDPPGGDIFEEAYIKKLDAFADDINGRLEKLEGTLDAVWNFWKKDQERPAWVQDFALWSKQEYDESLKNVLAKTDEKFSTLHKKLNANHIELDGKVWLLTQRPTYSVLGVTLGTVTGIVFFIFWAAVALVVLAHTQTFWGWMTSWLT